MIQEAPPSTENRTDPDALSASNRTKLLAGVAAGRLTVSGTPSPVWPPATWNLSALRIVKGTPLEMLMLDQCQVLEAQKVVVGLHSLSGV